MAVMLNAALGYTTEVMAVMLNAVLGVVWRPRRLAWVEVALFSVDRPEPVLGAQSRQLSTARLRSRDFAAVGAYRRLST
jgi:hypothetical protein